MATRVDDTEVKRRPTAILISGRGSNMLALLDAMRDDAFPASPALVLSNVPDAPGLQHARARGVLTLGLDHRAYASREEFDRAMHAALRESGAEIICLAGFMRLLSPWFCEAWRGRMINIHPSLLPAHKGLNTHRRVLEAGDQQHGCTVHFVTPGLDEGPTILQARVPVLPGDGEAALAARVLAEEHRIYPIALSMVARGEAALKISA
jgi:phosphoribosylglycinamide formyltransferase-1